MFLLKNSLRTIKQSFFFVFALSFQQLFAAYPCTIINETGRDICVRVRARQEPSAIVLLPWTILHPQENSQELLVQDFPICIRIKYFDPKSGGFIDPDLGIIVKQISLSPDGSLIIVHLIEQKFTFRIKPSLPVTPTLFSGTDFEKLS
jgi:hypothetical protein